MRKIYFIILLLLGLQQISSAQMPHWTSIRIPGDSLSPASLTFLDSLHGYFGAYKIFNDTNIVNDTNNYKQILIIWQLHYFETTDGGRSWKNVDDTVVIGPKNPLNGNLEANIREYNSPVVFGNLDSRYIFSPTATGTTQGAIAHSSDAGTSWDIPYRKGNHGNRVVYPLHAFAANTLLAYDQDSGQLFESFDGGKTYPKNFDDSVYHHTLYHVQGDTNYLGYGEIDSHYGDALSFDNSDYTHWTVALFRGDPAQALHPPTNPMGLQTLVTNDGGASWKDYLVQIPKEDSLHRVSGILQYIKGTPNLYYFTSYGAEGAIDNGHNTGKDYGNTTSDYGNPLFGINWLYSTDYGKSWEFNYSYDTTRRAFEAVRNNEVWITARTPHPSEDSGSAFIIAHTTDNGKTWEEDRKTLVNDGYYDGRIMTFSDPGHGWLAATRGTRKTGLHSYIFRYDASEQPQDEVESKQKDIYTFSLYPNPSAMEVHLKVGQNQSITKVEFYDIMGRKYFPSYNFDGNIATMNVSDLPNGSYVARVTYLIGEKINNYALSFIVQH